MIKHKAGKAVKAVKAGKSTKLKKLIVLGLALSMTLSGMTLPARGFEDTSYNETWYEDIAPSDTSLTVGLNAPSVGMTADTARSEYFGVMVTFYNADYDEEYAVEHDLDCSASSNDASASVPPDIEERNGVNAVPGGEMAGGHLFYMKSGQAVRFKNLPRYIEYGIKTFAPEAFDTMYRIKRQGVNDPGRVRYLSMSGPELESAMSDDNVCMVVDLALVSPWQYNVG